MIEPSKSSDGYGQLKFLVKGVSSGHKRVAHLLTQPLRIRCPCPLFLGELLSTFMATFAPFQLLGRCETISLGHSKGSSNARWGCLQDFCRVLDAPSTLVALRPGTPLGKLGSLLILVWEKQGAQPSLRHQAKDLKYILNRQPVVLHRLAHSWLISNFEF